MSEMVGMSGIQRGRIVHGVVMRGERVGVVVVQAGPVMLLITDQVARQEPVDRERIVGRVAGGRGRAEVHLVQLHGRATVAVERRGCNESVTMMQ